MAVGSIYRPPDGNMEQFIMELEAIIDNIPKLTKAEIFLLGDFKINYKTNKK